MTDEQILGTLVKTKSTTSNLVAPTLNYATIAALTEGYLPADLRDLVDRAIHQAAIRASPSSSVRPSLPSFHPRLTTKTAGPRTHARRFLDRPNRVRTPLATRRQVAEIQRPVGQIGGASCRERVS